MGLLTSRIVFVFWESYCFIDTPLAKIRVPSALTVSPTERAKPVSCAAWIVSDVCPSPPAAIFRMIVLLSVDPWYIA